MGMLVGFHTEGWDHLVLRAFLAKLLGISEDELEPDQLSSNGRGWNFVVDMLPKALHRFYGKCAQLAVISIDNDGNLDLMKSGLRDDPKHPRHWIHGENADYAGCRLCKIQKVVEDARLRLDWAPKKSGRDWPVLIAVPVEAIEAWLLAVQALLVPGKGSRNAENEARSPQKRQFYGKPEPSKNDVESKALPLIRAMDQDNLQHLREMSRSFGLFADQVENCRHKILGNRDCW